MNLLLDTHALLWWLGDDSSLSEQAREAIAAPENAVFLSAAVVWEIRIKQSIGKLTVPPVFGDVLADEHFVELPITIDHVNQLEGLPMIHRDPFDRMLVAQAMFEGLTIVSRDQVIGAYGVKVVPA